MDGSHVFFLVFLHPHGMQSYLFPGANAGEQPAALALEGGETVRSTTVGYNTKKIKKACGRLLIK